MGIKVNADMKSLLVAGDYGIISEYLERVHKFELAQLGNNDDNLIDIQKAVLEENYQSI